MMEVHVSSMYLDKFNQANIQHVERLALHHSGHASMSNIIAPASAESDVRTDSHLNLLKPAPNKECIILIGLLGSH